MMLKVHYEFCHNSAEELKFACLSCIILNELVKKSQLAFCEITLSLPNSPLTSAFIHSFLCVRHQSRHLESFMNETEKSLHICKAFRTYPCLPLPLFSSSFCLL